jgi:hypothetical protein
MRFVQTNAAASFDVAAFCPWCTGVGGTVAMWFTVQCRGRAAPWRELDVVVRAGLWRAVSWRELHGVVRAGLWRAVPWRELRVVVRAGL